ncbi:alpha/beta hydrolase [Marinoscillum furvescens]|uniref:Monoacylglycerol lipase n=1 Tax=Marinoscillum furvescens DSM 4134 TaxID=1122208 RepID=A0A3D9LIP6_MARFU|nr:alpha/beta hydrolase [Marinoscillum furvescens]REE05693.1 alpha-beta hydrolase superfamily lysophospholipase [Marinoscillum furvescens DSM 4134]
MSSESGHFLSQDGLKLFYRYWECESPRAILCIVHGLGEHSNRYHELAQQLANSGITTYAMDLRGHGKSEGKRGHARSIELLMSDIEELLKTARAEHTELPMYLHGQSMGGNLVANYAIRMNTNELSGMILTSPWLRLAFAPPAWKVKLAGIAKSIFPSLTQPNNLDARQFTKDENAIRAYNEDPLVHGLISAKLYTECAASSAYALDHADQIKLPALVFHGTADPIVDWKASQELTQCMSTKVQWVPLEHFLHEPLHDNCKGEVTDQMIDWMLSNS